MSHKQTISDYLATVLELPPHARAWLLDLWDAIQVFDDVVDGDPVTGDDMRRAVWSCLVQMPSNPFFAANSASLLPVMATAFLKWAASDEAERAGKADAKSFMWRASYYDVVLAVVMLCHKYDAALAKSGAVMALYGEKYTDYCAEFSHA